MAQFSVKNPSGPLTVFIISTTSEEPLLGAMYCAIHIQYIQYVYIQYCVLMLADSHWLRDS